MQITAAVARQAGAPLEMETLELEGPRAGEVRVRIVGAGVCHTDIVARDQLLPVPLPMVLGHEGSGIVEQVGPGVTSLAPGDRVVLSFVSCGACPSCADDEPAYCHQIAPLNFGGARPDGSTSLSRGGAAVHSHFFGQSSFATHALCPAASVVKVDASVPLELLGPLGCGVQTGAGTILRSLRAPAGSSVAVFGAGTVGLAAIMAARWARLDPIIAIDISSARLGLALELGATHALDAREGDIVARIQAIARGGVMYSMETSAALPALNDAIGCLARRGECALVTVPALGAPVPFSLLPLLTGGRRLIAVLEGDSEPDTFIPQLAAMHRAGDLPVERLVADYGFADIGRALAAAAAGSVVKPVLRF